MPSSKKQSKQQKGGNNSTTAALNVYGDGNAQHASSGNLIASRYVSNCSGGGKKQTRKTKTYGGKKQKQQKQQQQQQQQQDGGNIVTDIAVPAFLLYANNSMGPRKTPKNVSKKYRYSSKSRSNRR
jgi:hypothetical protein